MAKGRGISALQQVSQELFDVIEKDEIPRTEVTKLLWKYIKKNGLQNPKKRRFIQPDALLSKVLGKAELSMFAMPGKLNKHLTSLE